MFVVVFIRRERIFLGGFRCWIARRDKVGPSAGVLLLLQLFEEHAHVAKLSPALCDYLLGG